MRKLISDAMRAARMDFMFIDWRMRMEIEASTDAVRFLSGQALESEVPENTYEYQQERKE